MSNSSSGVFDSNQTHDYFFVISERIFVTVQCAFWIRFRQFWAPATAASSGGGATSTSATTPSGGGSTSGSGGGSTPTTSSGGSSSPTSSNQAAHRHLMLAFAVAGPISTTIDEHTARRADGTVEFAYLGNSGNQDLYTWTADGAHAHSVSVPAHDHSVTVPSHDHATPAHSHPAHSHDVPDHTHGLTYGIFKEPMPSSINVNAGLWRKPFTGGSWTLVASISGLTQEENYVDVTSEFVDDPSGLWRLTFQSAPGQPQGGRLTVDVVHDAWGAIQST